MGMPISVNIEQAVSTSKRTICVVSRSFARSDICMAEFNIARSFDIKDNKHRLIMILYEDIPGDEMPEDIENYVRNYTYIRKGTGFFCKRLLYRLSQNKMGPEKENGGVRNGHANGIGQDGWMEGYLQGNEGGDDERVPLIDATNV